MSRISTLYDCGRKVTYFFSYGQIAYAIFAGFLGRGMGYVQKK